MRIPILLLGLCLLAGPVQAQEYTVTIPARCAKPLFAWYERGFHPGEVAPLLEALHHDTSRLTGCGSV